MAFNRAGFRAIPGWENGWAYRDDTRPVAEYSAAGFWDAARAQLLPGALIYAAGSNGVVRLRVMSSGPEGVTVGGTAAPASILTETDAAILTEIDDPITVEA
jgi:hypothetical protein